MCETQLRMIRLWKARAQIRVKIKARMLLIQGQWYLCDSLFYLEDCLQSKGNISLRCRRTKLEWHRFGKRGESWDKNQWQQWINSPAGSQRKKNKTKTINTNSNKASRVIKKKKKEETKAPSWLRYSWHNPEITAQNKLSCSQTQVVLSLNWFCCYVTQDAFKRNLNVYLVGNMSTPTRIYLN